MINFRKHQLATQSNSVNTFVLVIWECLCPWGTHNGCSHLRITSHEYDYSLQTTEYSKCLEEVLLGPYWREPVSLYCFAILPARLLIFPIKANESNWSCSDHRVTTTRESLCHTHVIEKAIDNTIYFLSETVYFRHNQPTTRTARKYKERGGINRNQMDTWIFNSRPSSGALVVVTVDVFNVIMAWVFIHTSPQDTNCVAWSSDRDIRSKLFIEHES